MRKQQPKILTAVIAFFASIPALVGAQEFRAAFQVDPGQSLVVFQTGWTGPTTFVISGVAVVEVEGTEVRLFNYGIRTTPGGFPFFLLTFSQFATVDHALDTNGDGDSDTWLFSIDDTDCLDDGSLRSYAGVVSSETSQLPPDQSIGNGRLEVSGEWASCSPDAGWFSFEMWASETEIQPPLPIPTVSATGAASFILLLMLAGARLVRP